MPDDKKLSNRHQIRLGDDDIDTINYCIDRLRNSTIVTDVSSTLRFALNHLAAELRSGKYQPKKLPE